MLPSRGLGFADPVMWDGLCHWCNFEALHLAVNAVRVNTVRVVCMEIHSVIHESMYIVW